MLALREAQLPTVVTRPSDAELKTLSRTNAALARTQKSRLEDGSLKAELLDDGPPFDPFLAELEAPGGDIEHRKVGGLGIGLVKATMNRISYRREGGFNCVNIEMKVTTT
jgi:hypothetical protein